MLGSAASALGLLSDRDAAAATITGERLVADVYTLLGRAGRDRGDNLATLSVQLTPSENRTIRTPDIRRAWRKEVPSLPGIKRISVAERRGGPPGRDVDLRITGGDATVLKAAANDAAVSPPRAAGSQAARANAATGRIARRVALRRGWKNANMITLTPNLSGRW